MGSGTHSDGLLLQDEVSEMKSLMTIHAWWFILDH